MKIVAALALLPLAAGFSQVRARKRGKFPMIDRIIASAVVRSFRSEVGESPIFWISASTTALSDSITHSSALAVICG